MLGLCVQGEGYFGRDKDTATMNAKFECNVSDSGSVSCPN